jgi:hypothetical protein
VEKRDSVKSHEDIMVMFQELEELERRLRYREQEPLVSPEIPQDTMEPAPEAAPELYFEQVPEKKSRFSRKPGHRSRKKHSLFGRDKPSKTVEAVKKTVRPTFSLMLDEEGNLRGFDQPKPKPPKKPRALFHRKAKDASGDGHKRPSGRFARLGAVFSRKKSGSESEGSGLRGVLGKLKIRRGAKD